MENVKDYNIIIKLILLFAVLAAVTFGIKYYFQPFITIVILLIVTKPLYDLLLKINVPSKIAAAISILFINIFIVVCIIYLGNSIYNIVISFYRNNLYKFEGFIDNFINFFNVRSASENGYNILDNDFIKSGALSTGMVLFIFYRKHFCILFTYR